METLRTTWRELIATAAVALAVMAPGSTGAVWAQDNRPDPALVSLGEGIWKRAECRNCHGSLANGIGDVPQDPQGADLRKTQLGLGEIAKVIECGRPSTDMPYFSGQAYSDGRCYGVTAKDLGDAVPHAGTAMSPRQIEALAAFITANFAGKGDPTYEECVAFWGASASTCDRYPKK